MDQKDSPAKVETGYHVLCQLLGTLLGALFLLFSSLCVVGLLISSSITPRLFFINYVNQFSYILVCLPFSQREAYAGVRVPLQTRSESINRCVDSAPGHSLGRFYASIGERFRCLVGVLIFGA